MEELKQLNEFEAQQEQRKNPSRRAFFIWIGQIAADASLAAIGLGIEKPLTALASSAEPECTPCPPKGTCEVTECIGNPPCSEQLRYYKVYTCYLGGCINPGQSCLTKVCSGCAGGCDKICPPY
jgi:hypothetical protein